MRTKFSILFVLLVTAALLSACGTASYTGQQPRLISVNGRAEIKITPDLAYISIGVHTEDTTAKEAVAMNNSQAQAVIAALKEQGIAAEDIQTTNFSIYPYEKWGPEGQSLGTYYSVDNTVYVTLRDVDTLGSVLDEAITAGATNVSGISFDVEDKEALIAEGRTLAVADARSQAESLAEAAGVTLGEVYSLSYYNSWPTPYYYDTKGYGGAVMEASVPVSPGQLTLTVDVSISYEIK
jgi:hypothetical protein